ncbi:polysaccharide deacetylase [Domibacillus antri]|uniref:Polysaccharide deacetylase n=1 Tax=Domibacillus antri TaxID=1714264 RepID=A0A1Q8Q6N7_9BACI|nr:polysaccharide deacetylase family protein [Domibacillus antri]OLN23007.1 polysaccharide deacetylase [Domibacillus antri]
MQFPLIYEPVIDRKPIVWPENKKLVVLFVLNVEYFEPDLPSTSVNPAFAGFVPDVYNYSWRDYGARVGVWRIMEMLDKHNIPATVALNAYVCQHYPRIIEEIQKQNWEIIAHGLANSQPIRSMEEKEEKETISKTIKIIEEATGYRPKGWLGPALAETWNTPRLLEEIGIEYVCDWLNDEEPYQMATPGKKLISVPYSAELNDIQCFLRGGYMAPDYLQLLKDQFDVLHQESQIRGKVMTIPLHPFVIGHPFRMKYLEQAVKHMMEKTDVWFCTASDIVRSYRAQSFVKR